MSQWACINAFCKENTCPPGSHLCQQFSTFCMHSKSGERYVSVSTGNARVCHHFLRLSQLCLLLHMRSLTKLVYLCSSYFNAELRCLLYRHTSNYKQLSTLAGQCIFMGWRSMKRYTDLVLMKTMCTMHSISLLGQMVPFRSAKLVKSLNY